MPGPRVLEPTTQADLTGIEIDPADEAHASLRFDPVPDQLADLAAGDLIVSAPIAETAPYGFLYRVESVSHDGSALVIDARIAPLSDALTDGDVALDHTITADDIDTVASVRKQTSGADAVSLAWPRIDFTDVGLLCDDPAPCSISGHITLPDPQFSTDMQFDLQGVRRFMFQVAIDAQIALDLHGAFRTPAVGKEVTLYTLRLTPIDIQVGPIPVILVPRIEFKLGAKASIGLNVDSAGFDAEAHLQTGIDHVRDMPDRDLSSASADGHAYANQSVQTSLVADLYTRVDTGIYIYNGGGPYTYFEQGPRLDFATPRDPFFELGYRVSMGMGGRFDLIDPSILNLIDISGAFFDTTLPIYSSPDTAPLITSFTPVADQTIDPSASVTLSVDGYDLEQGPITDAMVQWSSDREGMLGTGKQLFHGFAAGGPGPRVVTATVTDAHGVASTRSVTITLDGAVPTVGIDAPTGSPTVFAGVSTSLSAHASSTYFPGEDLCTVPGALMYWQSSDGNDLFSNQTACGGTVTMSGTPGWHQLTFNASDPFGQTSYAQEWVYVQAAPSCYVTIAVTPAGVQVTNSGAVTSVQLDATIAPGCGAATMHRFRVVSHLPGNVTREYDFADGNSVTFNPYQTRTTADPNVSLMSIDTIELQPIDVHFDYVTGGTAAPSSGDPVIQYQYIPG